MARRRPSKAEATRVLNRYRSAAGAGPYTGKDPHGALKRHGIDYYGPHDTGVHLPTLYKATAKSRKGRMAAKAVAKRNAVRRKRAKRVATGVGAAGLVLTSAAAGRSVAKNHRQIRSAGRSAASRTVNASRSAASRSRSAGRSAASRASSARRTTTRRVAKARSSTAIRRIRKAQARRR